MDGGVQFVTIIGPALMLEWPADNLDFLQLVQYLYLLVFNVLSQASAHGSSQLKRQNLRVGGYTEKVVKRFNYSCTRATPDAKLAAMGPN